MKDILEKLSDLHVQATNEKSHYYTASLLREAIVEIMKLREELFNLKSVHNPHMKK